VKAKIVRCSDSLMWYNDQIGNVFVLIERFPEDKDVYWTREPAGYLNIIKRTDVIILENTN